MVSSCDGEFILGNMKLHLHFLLFLNIEMFVEISTLEGQGPVYPVNFVAADDCRQGPFY